MKTFTLLIAFLWCLGLNAQDEKVNNSWVIGGSTSLVIQDNYAPFSAIGTITGVGTIYSGRTEDSKNVAFAINPYIGKQINEKMLIGVDLRMTMNRLDSQELDFFTPGNNTLVDIERNTNRFGFGAFARYVFNPQKKLKLFIEPNLSYNLSTEEIYRDTRLDQRETSNFVSLGVRGGVLYDLNDKIRLTFRQSGISFSKGSWEVENTELKNDFQSFNVGFRLSSFSLGAELKF